MYPRATTLGSIVCLFLVSSLAAADPPKDLPDTAASAKLAAKMPKTVSGNVTLDGRPLAGCRVTDGVHFVVTDEEGCYSIELQPCELIPYLPSRTVSVCWPSGTWPTRKDRKGPFDWWIRLLDIKDAEHVDFTLKSQEQKLPVVATFGTDPHDCFTRPLNQVWRKETARAGRHATFAVAGGDLGYLGFSNAEQCYTDIADYTYGFPVPMFHCIGNHDIVAVHSKWYAHPHELAGYGAFIKYLGPVRWSFDIAGLHFVGMDWSLIDEAGKIQTGMNMGAIKWLEADLKSVADDVPVYFFNHQAWSPHEAFYDLLKSHNVKLCLGGHSHRNMYLADHNGCQIWTKMSEYTLVYCDKDDFEFVDRCIYRGGRTGWDQEWHHSHRACALYADRALEQKSRSKHVGLKDVTLANGAKTLSPVEGRTFDIRLGVRGTGDRPAKKWGLRVTHEDGFVAEMSYDVQAKTLNLLGRETYFDPRVPPAQGIKPGATPSDDSVNEPDWVEMRVYFMPHRIRVMVNNRLHYQQFIVPPTAKRIEVFVEGGQVEIGRFDLWQRQWPDDWEPRATINTG